MTLDEFIAGIPAALTPEALVRAVEANGLRYMSSVPLPDAARPVWPAARSQAKAAVLAVADVKTPGPIRDAAWAAVAVTMDAAGAHAVQGHILPEVFTGLVAPWEFMTAVPPTQGEQA